jgi:hypothetical protein
MAGGRQMKRPPPMPPGRAGRLGSLLGLLIFCMLLWPLVAIVAVAVGMGAFTLRSVLPWRALEPVAGALFAVLFWPAMLLVDRLGIGGGDDFVIYLALPLNGLFWGFVTWCAWWLWSRRLHPAEPAAPLAPAAEEPS